MAANAKRVVLPAYEFDVDAIPSKDRVRPTEGHKLKVCGVNPSRYRLWRWMHIGLKVRGQDFRLPTTCNPERFTTVAAYRWWREQINRLGSLESE